jgi:general transcription factor 3C polypeptide 5 (transcription factor C subunit 1)
MADYQYQPDINDPVTKLRIAMEKMDGTTFTSFDDHNLHTGHIVEAITKYVIPPEKEDYMVPVTIASQSLDFDPQLAVPVEMRSNLRMFPPPLFSRQGISHNYKWDLSFLIMT